MTLVRSFQLPLPMTSFPHPLVASHLRTQQADMSSLSSSTLQSQNQPPSVPALSLALEIPALRVAIQLPPSEELISQDEWHQRTDDVDLDDVYDKARKNLTILDASVLIAQTLNHSVPNQESQDALSGATKVIGEYRSCLLELTLYRTAKRAA